MFISNHSKRKNTTVGGTKAVERQSGASQSLSGNSQSPNGTIWEPPNLNLQETFILQVNMQTRSQLKLLLQVVMHPTIPSFPTPTIPSSPRPILCPHQQSLVRFNPILGIVQNNPWLWKHLKQVFCLRGNMASIHWLHTTFKLGQGSKMLQQNGELCQHVLVSLVLLQAHTGN